MEETAAVTALSALAQDVRLRTFRLLVAIGPEGMAAGQIAEELGLPANTLSFHLSALKNAGLVTVRRDGRSLIYSADFAAMRALIGFLSDQCCTRAPKE